jgi:DNA mismatch repair protein MutL
MSIKILSNTIVNRIAAGEVVERPASAVKELVENSIDAKASKVDVIIENAGKNLITIMDNGAGMHKDDLSLCIERHATSKLPAEDINQIEFFGFRGEALPSIASVSRMNITSKQTSSSDVAWNLEIIGGERQELSPAALNMGTKIEVRDLFFATPARLKFLKTEKTEINYIKEIITKIAMANPEVALSLTSDGKELLNLKNYSGNDALYNRLNDLIGKGFKENFSYLELNDYECKVSGYVSLPTYNIGTSTEQYFFINKRPVRDKLLSMAVKIAYQDFIPSGRYPLVYLFLEMDSSLVDVNVHPSKLEVRFKDSAAVRSIIISAIKQVIRNIGQKASDHLSEAAINSFVPNDTAENKTSLSSPSQPYAPMPSKAMSMPSKTSFTRPQDNIAKPIAFTEVQTNNMKQIFAPIAPVSRAEPNEFDQKQIDFPLGSACGQIHDTYILSQTNDGMILVDQHAAHERIFYEKLKEQINKEQIQTQRLFIPEIIELEEHIIEQLLEAKQEFARMGLYFDKFGAQAISVSELPSLLKCTDVRKLILDIVDDLKEYGDQVSLEKKINHYLATFACHHSIRSGRSLSIREMNSLLREMESCDHTGQCNHGRPTYIRLSLKDINKLFERT